MTTLNNKPVIGDTLIVKWGNAVESKDTYQVVGVTKRFAKVRRVGKNGMDGAPLLKVFHKYYTANSGYFLIIGNYSANLVRA